MKGSGRAKLDFGNCWDGRNRDRPRFFDQVGHQTTNASIGNRLFFTKS